MTDGSPSRDDDVTRGDDLLLARLARGLSDRGLAAPALITLECLRPLGFLGGQALRVVSPLLEVALARDDWDRLAGLLESRASVERLISHLEAAPSAVACKEPVAACEDAAYVVVDCGSTTTKAVLLGRRETRYHLLGRAEAPTTVEAPVENVMVGVRTALTRLQAITGHRIIDDDGSLITARTPADGVGAVLATSSAGGGLQMLVMGLVRGMTAASAERAALGAGAIVTDVLAWNDEDEEPNRLDRIRRVRPDMVLLAGGTDGGAVEQVVALAEQLAAADLRPRWGEGLLPVVFAGNPAAASAVVAALEGAAEVAVAANIRPNLEEERLAPVRRVLHEVFLRHVMSRAPGYGDLQALCTAPVMPTPSGFGEALAVMAAGHEGDTVAVDLGGATCDVFSVHEHDVRRSVSANLGLSFSLGAVCQRAGWERISRWLPFMATPSDLRDRVRNKMVRPTTLPQTPEDLLLEQAVAREALRLALDDHDRTLQPLRGGRAGPGGVEALGDQDETPVGVEWSRVRTLLGSGGPLAHAPRRRQAAAILIDACRPQGVTELAVDSVFVLPHLGVLHRTAPEAAEAVLAYDAVVVLGTCVAPIGERIPAAGEPLAELTLTATGLAETRKTTLLGGQLRRLEMSADSPRQLVVTPMANWDFGAGNGQELTVMVRGGPAGLVLDGRGRKLEWPESAAARMVTVSTWLEAMGAMPPGVVS